MATTKNITMKQFNGTDYDTLYPKTVYSQVSGVAPAGYGLGGGATKIDNLNNAVNNGWYLTAGTVSNGPKESIYGWMLVSSRSGSGGMIRQDFWEAMTNPIHYVRYAVNGEFKEWEYVNPPMEVGVEYRTTEQYRTKPVYVKLVGFGALPNATAKEMNVSVQNNAQLLECKGFLSGGGVLPYSYPGNSMGTANVYTSKGTGSFNIFVITDTDLSGKSAYFILKYTKTTD